MSPPDKPPSTADRPRFGLRFSLWTLFVLAILASLVISNLMTSYHLQRSQQVIAEREAQIEAQQKEIEQYQDQLGILRVKDETKTHIIAIETFEETVWRWRVFVPEGETYRIKSVIGDIPDQGFPTDHQYTGLRSGETRLTISIMQGPDGTWKEKIEQAQGRGTSSMSTVVPSEKMGWYTRSGSSSTNEISPNSGQKEVMSDQPITLLRRRSWPRPEPGQTIDQSKPSDGVLLWLEPVPKPDEPES